MAGMHRDGSLRKGKEVSYKVTCCSQNAIPGSKCPLKSPVLKSRSLVGEGQLGGGGTSLWSAMKYSKRLGPQQADVIIERPSDHEGFDPVSRSIPW